MKLRKTLAGRGLKLAMIFFLPPACLWQNFSAKKLFNVIWRELGWITNKLFQPWPAAGQA